MINAPQLRELVVRPALRRLELWSEEAENIVIGTAAVESKLHYLKQLGDGPALGLWQIEPATHDDVWGNYLLFRIARARALHWVAGHFVERYEVPQIPPHDWLVYNLRYAAGVCRLIYRRAPEALPSTVDGMAALWKLRYNTPKGKGTEEDFVRTYEAIKGTL